MLEIPNSAERLKRLALDPSVFTGDDGKDDAGIERKRGRAKAREKQTKPRKNWSFIFCVLVPGILAALYYFIIAADQYAAQSRFAIRGPESSSGGPDLLGIVTGMGSSTSTSSDAYIIIEYIYSRELVEDLDKRINLRKIYSRDEADYFASFNPKSSIEDFIKYWKSMVTIYYDATGGILELEVKAFTAEDAKLVSEHVIAMSERLINNLSRKVRDDAVSEAKSELARAENRLRLARTAIAGFRETTRMLDPSQAAVAEEGIVTKLQTELVTQRAELATLQNTMSETAPRVKFVRSKVDALQKQIDDERVKIAIRERSGGKGSLTNQLKMYEELATEREFAQKAYISALASIERARIEADRQQRYLTVFVHPRTPEEALYPERLRWALIIFAGLFLLWGIGSLAIASIKDHMI